MIKTDIKSTWHGNEIKIQGKKVVNKSAYETGLIVEGQAKQLCPVDTGRLAGSITTQSRSEGTQPESPATNADVIKKPQEDNTTLVGTSVEYGIWQEFGTRSMDAQPFLRPALDLAKGKTLTILEENGKKYFKDYLRRPE